MALKVGVGSVCQVGIQTTFGTSVVPDTLVNMTSESITLGIERGDEGNLIASKTPNQRDMLAITVDGGISMILRPETADWLFKAALGAGSSAAGYTLVAPNADLPVSTVVMSRGGIVKTYPDVSIRSMTLNAAAQDYVKVDLDVVGIKEINAGETGAQTVQSIAFTLPSYRCTAATLKYGTAGSSATTALCVENCEITIDNGLEDTPSTYCDGFYAGRPAVGQRTVTVNFQIPYSDALDTFRTTYYSTENAPALSMQLKFTTSNDNEYVTVDIPHLMLTGGENPVSGGGYIDCTFTGEALSVGSTEPITITVEHDET